MIKSNGSKIYTTNDIKKMSQSGYSREFMEYFDRMPDSLKSMVLSWGNIPCEVITAIELVPNSTNDVTQE